MKKNRCILFILVILLPLDAASEWTREWWANYAYCDACKYPTVDHLIDPDELYYYVQPNINVPGECVVLYDGHRPTTLCEFYTTSRNMGSKNNNPQCNGTNPIHTAMGFKLQQETDYRSQTPNPLIFKRYYTSGNHWVLSDLGSNWRHNYSKHIQLDEATSNIVAYIYRANGDKFTYIQQEDNLWLGDPDIKGRLESVEGGGWRHTDSQENVEIYNSSGKLISITNRAGVTQTLSYNSSGLLEMVVDTFGNAISFTYNADNLVETLTDTADNVYRYSYDATGKLISVTYPDDTPADTTDNPKRIYHYENSAFPHALTGITDENGNRYATWTYDSEGRAISSEHTNGVDQTTFSFNEDGSTTITNALGKQTTYRFADIRGYRYVASVEGHQTNYCAGANKSYSYDANGNVISKTDWNGVTTTYSYDMARNLELTRTEAVGTPQERVITTEWHSDFRLPTKITEPGKVAEYSYDAQGRQLSSKISNVQ